MRKLLFLVAAVALAQRPWPPPGMRCPERIAGDTRDVEPANASKINEFYDEHLAYHPAADEVGKNAVRGSDGRRAGRHYFCDEGLVGGRSAS